MKNTSFINFLSIYILYIYFVSSDFDDNVNKRYVAKNI